MVMQYDDDDRPAKDWILRTDYGLDGDSLSYEDRMERKGVEEERRAKERQLMEEGRAMWRQKKAEEAEILFRDIEEVKEFSRKKMFGKPGNGAPTEDIRKKRFTEYQLDRSQSSMNLDQLDQYMGGGGGGGMNRWGSEMNVREPEDAMAFGRQGYGAPVRTKSGRLRSMVRGNPEIRFQANEAVQNSICNQIRYASSKEEKAKYHSELDEQMKWKNQTEAIDKSNSINVCRTLGDDEGKQWGKPGPGGAYWRESALTGQGFNEKMGWSVSADPRRRQFEVKRGENEALKREIVDIENKRVEEHRDLTSDVGLELAPLMKAQPTGNPRKDPSTGYMMDAKLTSTDITKHAAQQTVQPWHSQENKSHYWTQLTGQVEEKKSKGTAGRVEDQAAQAEHFQVWDKFWGRPGYGAPRQSGQNKENLMKMLHYPKQAPNNLELSTLERLPVK